MHIVQLNVISTPLINKFYKQHRGRGRAIKQDQNWVVKDPDIIAACRVQHIEGVLLLSSVLVAPKHRSKGIARALLTQVFAQQNAAVYTFAYRHLYEFYQQMGLCECTLPSQLQPYFDSYVAQKRDIVAMCLPK
ncbi:GNAT family N-acetyltransferase [Pseudoalteromonas sp. JBTF-M23]|uniref:GNAT family N-acetyltransferase n=1 Tax=Pseudoalteromonas caenipelagi TaxID=2726988 RepID=A0A849VLH9_9GAMM|nr:GNAT family N-acetyltransferase [Pseudoalteromonas caenipelagi]